MKDFGEWWQQLGNNSTWSKYDFAKQFYIAGVNRSMDVIDDFSCQDREHGDCGHASCALITDQILALGKETDKKL